MRRRDRSTLMLPLRDEIVVDSFAGGGGASTGIELALGRPVDVAINHDPVALALHAANHPATTHFAESVFKVDPEAITGNQPVGLLWASPDCTHFSKAKGGAPRSPRVRGLAWVVIRWARRVKPRVILLENVEEFATWGPLLEDGSPCPVRKGTTFRLWVNQLRGLGYAVDWRVLRACDYGAPTTRKRLFLVARCDGRPISWPEPTHGPGTGQAWRSAASIIDWTIPVPSIFDRAKPLAEATQRRIAEGIRRYVVDCPDPFIVPTTSGPAGATLVQTGYGERPGQAPRVPGLHKPLGTCVNGQKHALVAAFIAQANTGVVGHDAREPMSTLTIKGSQQQPVTVTLGGPDDRSDEVAAFLLKFYSTGGQWGSCRDPLGTVTTKDRLGLVTVHGRPHRIVDIGLRMLTPRELYSAQGFPADYIIDRTYDHRPITKVAQVRMCGNSVCPPVAAALVRANFKHENAWRHAA